MPRPCVVCNHGKRDEIEIQLVAGIRIGAISQSFGVSSDCLRRHQASHLKKRLEVVAARAEKAGAKQALRFHEKVQLLWERTMDSVGKIEDIINDPNMSAEMKVKAMRAQSSLLNQAHRNTEMHGRADGELRSEPGAGGVAVIMNFPAMQTPADLKPIEMSVEGFEKRLSAGERQVLEARYSETSEPSKREDGEPK